jgi:hypothetical protein
MFTAAVRIDAELKWNVGAVVAADDALGLVGKKLRLHGMIRRCLAGV